MIMHYLFNILFNLAEINFLIDKVKKKKTKLICVHFVYLHCIINDVLNVSLGGVC